MKPPADDMTVRLLGREDELLQIRKLVGHARNGRGGSLLLTGDPGIGKTSLLSAATTDLRDILVMEIRGYEAESAMPFAAVQRLVRPLSMHVESLPETHRHALRVASGEEAGQPPDRFLVGLGVLGLLASAGEVQPVVCIVDDAHLLDAESLDVLGFVGRRLEAESAVLLMAGRATEGLLTQTAGVPSETVGGLAPEAAVQVLMTSLSDPIDPSVAIKVVAATGGNPLALVDLASELTVRQLTESSFGDEPLPIGRHLEQHYLRQVRKLTDSEQVWLLVAAADSSGDMDLISATADELGLPDDVGDAAESAGLVELGRTVRFRHPLVRSAAYNAAAAKERRRVHRALSVIFEKNDNAEQAAWHSAKTILGTDEEVAQQLEEVADLAALRGGFVSRARVLVESASLTPPGRRKYSRLVSAAEAALAAGSAQLAKELLDEIDEDVLDPVSRGRMITVGADHALFVGTPSLVTSTAEMLRAADCFHGEDAELEQSSLIKAWEWALPPERLAQGFAWDELGTRLLAGAKVRAGKPATILKAISAMILMPYAEAVPVVRAGVDMFDQMTADELLTYGHASVALTTFLWDLDARSRIIENWADAARDAGSLSKLDNALWLLSITEVMGGTPRRAVQYMEQVRELRRAIGWDAEHVVNVAVLAWTSSARAQVLEIADMTYAMGFGGVQATAMASLATVEIAEGNYAAAHGRLKPFVDDPFLHVTAIMWPDYAEAAVRSGHLGEALDTVEKLESMARMNGSVWARGVALRTRALLGVEGTAATDQPSAVREVETTFRASIDALDGTRALVDLGRAHLGLGEWLRRMKRRKDARPHLRTAADLFARSGTEPFVERANRELEATGDSARPPMSGARGELTQQERTVAELAASGRTNAEIAATMFLSANTIDYHLRKVYQKLAISSRRQLTDRLCATRTGPGSPAVSARTDL